MAGDFPGLGTAIFSVRWRTWLSGSLPGMSLLVDNGGSLAGCVQRTNPKADDKQVRCTQPPTAVKNFAVGPPATVHRPARMPGGTEFDPVRGPFRQ